MVEGRNTVPPISGLYLFHPRATTVDDLDLPFVEGMRADRIRTPTPPSLEPSARASAWTGAPSIT